MSHARKPATAGDYPGSRGDLAAGLDGEWVLGRTTCHQVTLIVAPEE